MATEVRAGVAGKRIVWVGDVAHIVLVAVGVAVSAWAILCDGGGGKSRASQDGDKGDDDSCYRGHFWRVGRARCRWSSLRCWNKIKLGGGQDLFESHRC